MPLPAAVVLPLLKRAALPLLAMVAIIAVCLYIRHKGYEAGATAVRAMWAEEKKRLKEQHDAEVERLRSVNREVEVRYIPKVEYVRGETRTLVKEVPVYVTAEDDAACPSTAGLTRLHDRALGPDAVPRGDGAGGPVGATPAAPLSEIGAVVAANYGACREFKLRAEALMEWAALLKR